MNLNFMQRVDQWVGAPIVWLLQRFTPRARSLGGDGSSEGAQPVLPKKIVIAKFLGLGSVVVSFPLLKSLKEQGVRVIFLTFPSQAEVLRISGLVDDIWLVDTNLKRFVFSVLGTAWKLFRERPEAFIDLEPTSNFSAILGRISRAPARIGFLCGQLLRENLFTHLVALTSHRHMSENFLIIGELLGMKRPEELALPTIPESALARDKSIAALPDSLKDRKRIVINLTTSEIGSYHRSWPHEKWVELSRELLKDPEAVLLFPGLPSHDAQVQAIVDELPFPGRVYNLCGRTNIRQLLNVLKDSALVVSLDSGIMHLAAWAGAKVVGLFGPETPKLYAPLSAHSLVIWLGLHCSPCCTVATQKHTRCLDNQCMKRISVSQVGFACRQLLTPKPQRTAKPAKTDAA